MLQQLLEAALQGSSMESMYLSLIALLDQAETVANNAWKQEVLPGRLALAIGEAKQGVIEAFADANIEFTLGSMRERFEDESVAEQVTVTEE